MIRLTELKCKNCGHHHRQYASTRDWEEAEKFNLIYTTGCFDCRCMNYEAEEQI